MKSNEQIADEIGAHSAFNLMSEEGWKIGRARILAALDAKDRERIALFDSSKPPDISPMVWLNGDRVPPPGHVLTDDGQVRVVPSWLNIYILPTRQAAEKGRKKPV